MSKVNWRTVIVKIKKERKWPKKTIAHKMGITSDMLYRWQRGETEPKYSQGAELLKLAGMAHDGQP